MKKKTWKKFVGMAAALSLLALAACGSDTEEPAEQPQTPSEQLEVETETEETAGRQKNIPVSNLAADGTFSLDHSTFVQGVTNNGEVLDGGTLNYGIVQGAPFAGILNALWGTTAPDANVRQFFDEPMYQVGADLMMNQDGVATWELAEDGKTFTWRIRDGVYWHDGTQLTARDWVFAFEVLASPDYTGNRFDQQVREVAGIMDFHNGSADEIAGLRIIDELTLEMEYNEASPSLLAGGIWANALPYHLFADIPVGEMQDHPLVRTEPIGFGPFKVNTMVPGESVSFVRNDDYWQGAPVLDEIVASVVNADVVGQEILNGSLDIVNSFPQSFIPNYFDATNVEWIGTPAGSFSYIAFMMGEYADGDIQPYEDHPAQDVHLRRALWQAVDWDEVGRRLFSGLVFNANGILPPAFTNFYDESLRRPEASIEAAKATLEAGGFLDVTGDGFVENPDGSPLVLNFFGTIPGSPAAEAHQLFLIQSWEAAGINVVLNNVEFITLTEMIDNNDPEIDLYNLGWSWGWDPNPGVLFGRGPFNRTGYASEQMDALLEAINGPEAVDPAVRRAAMSAWQEYVLENVVMIPTTHSLFAVPVNDRVQNFDLGSLGAYAGSGGGFWHQVGVSETRGIANGQ